VCERERERERERGGEIEITLLGKIKEYKQ
jgi:hypothetical protein